MALRVLTSIERQILQGSNGFVENLSWAIRDYADYWSIHNGANLDDTQRVRWARDKYLSGQINSFDISDPALGLKAVKLAKGMEFDLEVAPQPLEALLAAIPSNRYEELAGLYFQLEGKKLPF